MLKIIEIIVALAWDTPEAAGAADVHVVPSDTKTLPFEPGATKLGVDVPLPRITLLSVKVVRPVPPWSTPRVPVDTKFLLASVKTGLLAVRPESRMFPTVSLVPSNVMLAEAPKAPELLN
jgi:hypothetical protein